jgi:hypothetical protein
MTLLDDERLEGVDKGLCRHGRLRPPLWTPLLPSCQIMKDEGWFMSQYMRSLSSDDVERSFGLHPLGACGAW